MRQLSRATLALAERAHQRAAHRSWLAPWRGSGGDVAALLERIGAAGEALAIPSVIALAFDRRAEIARAAGEAITLLRARAATDELLAIDRRLRSDLVLDRARWRSLVPGDLAAAPNASVLALAMSHPDGHVRERAIVLAASQRADLPLLLVRTNDWVPAIRELARTAMRARIDLANASQLTATLPLLDRHQRARPDPALAGAIEALLRDSRALPAMLAALSSADRDIRRAAYRRMLDAAEPADADPYRSTSAGAGSGVFAAALRDGDPAVRRWAAKRLLASPHARIEPHAARLCADRSHAIRLAAAQRVARRGALPWQQLLCDEVADIRALAQQAARAASADPAAMYRARLAASAGGALRGALAGLAEVGDLATDGARLRARVDDRSPGVRCAALLALAKLGADDLIALALVALRDAEVTRRLARQRRAISAQTPERASQLRALAAGAGLADEQQRALHALLDARGPARP